MKIPLINIMSSNEPPRTNDFDTLKQSAVKGQPFVVYRYKVDKIHWQT